MTLMVGAVDIGNKLDIPKRTIDQIEKSDVLVCEYIASCKHMMHNLGIDISNKIFIEFNAYVSMREKVIENVFEMAKSGKSVMIVGTEGTPLIIDPGFEIVKYFRENGIHVESVPGPSSVTSAISTSGIFPNKFYFGGFMPLQSKDRIPFLIDLKNRADCAIVILEPLFSSGYQSCLDIQEVFGKEKKMSLHINMTRENDQSVLLPISECVNWIDKIINSEFFPKHYNQSSGLVYVIDNWPTTY